MSEFEPTKVYVVGTDFSVQSLFKKEYGCTMVRNIDDAELAVFTGGQDIGPWLYGDRPHKSTYSSPSRDQIEMEVYYECIQKQVSMAGICRGGQLMNALNNGSMWQDVDGHNNGRHPIRDEETGKIWMVTSIHHQMMIPAKSAEVLAVAKQAKRFEGHKGQSRTVTHNEWLDIEALWYPKTRALCFQGHPEYDQKGDSAKYFKELLLRFQLIKDEVTLTDDDLADLGNGTGKEVIPYTPHYHLQ